MKYAGLPSEDDHLLFDKYDADFQKSIVRKASEVAKLKGVTERSLHYLRSKFESIPESGNREIIFYAFDSTLNYGGQQIKFWY